MNSIHIEDLLDCSHESLGGTATRIWYAPAGFFEIMELPQADAYEQSKTIESNKIKLVSGKKLSFIDVFVEQNSLGEKVKNGTRKQKTIVEFSFSLREFNARNLGFASRLRNEGLVFLVPDTNGRVWLFGTKRNAAYLTSYESNTGRKVEDDNVVSLVFSANTELYLYNGKAEEMTTAGGFSKGFSKGFKI